MSGQRDLLSRLREQAEWYSDGHGPLHKEAADEIERLSRELDKAVQTVRRWHKAALAMRDMSITGKGDIQDFYFDAAMSIPFYGADGEPLPSAARKEKHGGAHADR